MGSTDEALPATEELTDDDAMPAFEVPETAEALDEGATDAPVEGEVDPEVAAIVAAAMPYDFDADAADDDQPEAEATDAADDDQPEAEATDAAADDQPEAEAADAADEDQPEADEDNDEPVLDLPPAHDEDLNARIDAHIAAMHERIDAIIGGLRSS